MQTTTNEFSPSEQVKAKRVYNKKIKDDQEQQEDPTTKILTVQIALFFNDRLEYHKERMGASSVAEVVRRWLFKDDFLLSYLEADADEDENDIEIAIYNRKTRTVHYKGLLKHTIS